MDPRILIVSLLTGAVVSRSTWSEWAVDNGDCLSLQDVTEVADRLRTTGEHRINDHLLVNADFEPAQAAA